MLGFSFSVTRAPTAQLMLTISPENFLTELHSLLKMLQRNPPDTHIAKSSKQTHCETSTQTYCEIFQKADTVKSFKQTYCQILKKTYCEILRTDILLNHPNRHTVKSVKSSNRHTVKTSSYLHEENHSTNQIHSRSLTRTSTCFFKQKAAYRLAFSRFSTGCRNYLSLLLIFTTFFLIVTMTNHPDTQLETSQQVTSSWEAGTDSGDRLRGQFCTIKSQADHA